MIPTATALLDRLGRLFDYPMPDLQECVAATIADLASGAPPVARELDLFAREIDGMTTGQLQEHYSGAFDWSASCSLHLGWHLFGDAHERGAFMAMLHDDFRRAHVPESDELPDHLIQILALLGREEPERAALLAALIAPALEAVKRSLASYHSPYAHLMAAVQAAIAAVTQPAGEEAPVP